MHQMELTKEMLDFQKSVFDNSYSALLLAQMQAENVANAMYMQAQWIPEEAKRLIDQMTQALKKGQKDFKEIADQNYDALRSAL